MSTRVCVEFLGWDEPGLWRAAARLAAAYKDEQALRMDRAVVALPGARAGRRLAELLAEHAEQAGLVLRPGPVVTIGTLPELLFAPERRVAGRAARLSGWVKALRGLDEASLEAVVPRPPGAEESAGWLALAERVMGLHETLAGGAVRFTAVPQLAADAGLIDFDEAERWAALAEAETAYAHFIEDAGLSDPQLARLAALDTGRVELAEDLWLVGVTEMPTLVRRMIELLDGPVTAMVPAPSELAERFDGLGTVIPSRWADAEIEIEEAGLRVADGPAGQAGAAVRAIAAGEGRFVADQITVGVCDESVGPHLQRQLSAFGVDSRVAAGRPVERSGPARLLTAAAEYLAEDRFGAFAAMVRHPDLAAWLKQTLSREPGETGARLDHERSGRGEASEAEVGVDAWLGWVDAYYNAHLQQRLIGGWLGEGARDERMRRVKAAVDGPGLLGPMRGERRLSEWAERIGTLLGAVYGGRPLRRRHERERGIIESCESIGRALEELAALPAPMDATVGAAEAIGLVLRLIDGASIAPETEGAAVELLGWLELALDDAPQLVVTGLNEGRAPESVVGDAFLPDRLRTALGLVDNARRYARDAWALSTMVHGRADCTLVMGRRSGSGEPLMPSRLMFAAERPVVLERARWFYESPAEAEATPVAAGEPEGSRPLVFETPALWPPPPSGEAALPRSLPVTAFGDYLACPYRFYLRHVLKLMPVDDRAVELDAAGFGTLLHEAVKAFGEAAARSGVDASDEEAVRRWTTQRLASLFAERFGERPAPALWVQREQARRRLIDFARWQAAWSAEGWRIEHVELMVDNAAIEVDGQAMGLRGRIDRIDVNTETGERLLLDYKTGDRAKTPQHTHLAGPRDAKQWVDLQLPLYRTLAAAKGIEGIADVGYINLPRAAREAGAALAGWDDAALDEARETAARVIRSIRERRFYPPSETPPAFDQYAAICGVDQFAAAADDEDDDEAAAPGGPS